MYVTGATLELYSPTGLLCLTKFVASFSPQPQKVVQEVTEEQQVRKVKFFKCIRVVQFCFDAALEATGFLCSTEN